LLAFKRLKIERQIMSFKSNVREKSFRTKILFAVVAAFVVSAYPGYFLHETNAQEEKRNRSEAGYVECVSYCSTTRPGTAIMEVRWRLADRLLSATDLRARASQQRLDVTVYSDGFDRGLYATVTAVKPKAPFRMAAGGVTVGPTAQRKLPGLEKLVITDVATRVDRPAKSFLLMQPMPGAAADAEWVTVRMEGLDPGMEYTYRIPGANLVITCQAVVCPVDRISAPPKRKPK
jgi:hypothetical protein